MGRCWHDAECEWLPPRKDDEGVVRRIEEAQVEIGLLRDAVIQ